MSALSNLRLALAQLLRDAEPLPPFSVARARALRRAEVVRGLIRELEIEVGE